MAKPRKTVTRLRVAGRGRVAVDLDGARWRVIPLEAAQVAGLVEGLELDRERLRTLRRELRRGEALGAAVGALRQRDHSRASLALQLARRGVAAPDREAALGVLGRAGLVDDERLAHGRAAALAARGGGDRLIADDLARRGLPPELVEAAVASLEPEPARAARIVTRRGSSARTFRFLAGRGFAAESLEGLVADSGAEALG